MTEKKREIKNNNNEQKGDTESGNKKADTNGKHKQKGGEIWNSSTKGDKNSSTLQSDIKSRNKGGAHNKNLKVQ